MVAEVRFFKIALMAVLKMFFSITVGIKSEACLMCA